VAGPRWGRDCLRIQPIRLHACSAAHGAAAAIHHVRQLARHGLHCRALPDGNAMSDQSVCDVQDHGIWLDHTATRGQVIGADPVMGTAEAIGCRVVADDTDVKLMETSPAPVTGTT
jgi:hypothetical protein